MKISTITLKPGSIIVWKEYSKWDRFFNKILNKKLKFNKCTVNSMKSEWVTLFNELKRSDFYVLEPKKPYSKIEQEMLIDALAHSSKYLQEIEKLAVVNIIRPETINLANITLDDLCNNKYYKLS